MLIEALIDRPDDPLLACDGVRVDRRSASAAIRSRAALMRETGVRPGARVLLFGGHGTDFWIDLVAIWAAGAVAIPLEDTIQERQLGHIIRIAAPDRSIGVPRNEDHDDLPERLVFGPPGERAARPLDPAEIAEVEARDLAALMFTSGTTGDPKGVMVRHEMLSMNALGTQSRLRLRPSDRLGIAIPFRFISSLSHFLVAMLAGCSFVATEKRLMPRDLLAFIEEEKLTAFGGAPVQMRILADAPADTMPGLRWVMSSGDHLSPEIIDTFRERRPSLAINCVYGLTELAGRFCILSSDLLARGKGSVGTAIPGLSLSILDDQGKPAAAGEIGHVYANGLCCFEGYLGDDKATSEALDSNGFRTGDLGRLDASGFLHLAGRSDSVFKRAGLKVSCLPIADALMATGMFADVAVLPRDDQLAGAVPVAYVVPNDAGYDRGDVLRRLRAAIPPNHLPASFVTLPEIPRTGSGKIRRRELEALVDKAAHPQ